MGLTIHYTFKHPACTVRSARGLVERLRQRALDLPFQAVGPLVQLTGDACDYQKCHPENPNRWLLIQSSRLVEIGPRHYFVQPKKIIAFTANPGNGCEPANFGLCLYPATIESPHSEGPDKRLRTRMGRWLWRSFCKTQYASNPNYGGVENFLRCHLLVIRMCDHARELGILEDVTDESGYWEKREMPALAREVGGWNEMIAEQVGKLKDMLGDEVAGEILTSIRPVIKATPSVVQSTQPACG